MRSRGPSIFRVPYLRGVERSQWLAHHTFYKHLGLYAFRTEVLCAVTALPQSTLEKAESLEQMRGFTSVDFARLHPGGSLGRRLLMTVGNVMRSHDLPVVAPDCSATDMIHAISKGGLGLIIICDGERIEGIVTDGDVRRAMERRRAEFFNIKAADIATPNPKTISADKKLIEAEKMMTRNKVTSLLVTDDAGKLQGVIQIYDIKL